MSGTRHIPNRISAARNCTFTYVALSIVRQLLLQTAVELEVYKASAGAIEGMPRLIALGKLSADASSAPCKALILEYCGSPLPEDLSQEVVMTLGTDVSTAISSLEVVSEDHSLSHPAVILKVRQQVWEDGKYLGVKKSTHCAFVSSSRK